MPCYEVREISVELKIENIDLLKKALRKLGLSTSEAGEKSIFVTGIADTNYSPFSIDLGNSRIITTVDEKRTTLLANKIKRSYSEVVINELAQKNKWFVKKSAPGQFALQRY